MDHEPELLEPRRVIGERVRQLRTRNGWTALQLAKEMARVGIPWERQVVTKLETGRRQSISVEEFLALAYVLDVAPVHLLVPPDASDASRYRVVPTGERELSPKVAREWIRGRRPIRRGPGGVIDARRYFTEVPPEEYRLPGFSQPPKDGALELPEPSGGDDG